MYLNQLYTKTLIHIKIILVLVILYWGLNNLNHTKINLETKALGLKIFPKKSLKWETISKENIFLKVIIVHYLKLSIYMYYNIKN